MARSLNKVQLIGNLTRDPELRYTPTGTAVCTFTIATNRSWTTDTGEKHEETDFHRVVAWNKLAELCSQFLVKGRKVYVEGRLSNRSWTGQDGAQKTTTEVVIDDMILLDSARRGDESHAAPMRSAPKEESKEEPAESKNKPEQKPEAVSPKPKKEEKKDSAGSEEVDFDDIPF